MSAVADAPLLRMTARWCAVGAVALVTLYSMFFVVGFEDADTAHGEDLFMFGMALREPGLVTVAFAFDVLVWFALGGLVVLLSRLVAPRNPRAALVAQAAGTGAAVVGALGGYVTLFALPKVAAAFAAGQGAAPGALGAAQALTYLTMSAYGVGQTLFASGFLLVGVALLADARFPRWLSALLVTAGGVGLLNQVLFVGLGGESPIFFFGELLNLAVFLGFAVKFWSAGGAGAGAHGEAAAS